MSTVDRELIHRKLEDLRDYRQKLEELRGIDRATYANDHHHYVLAESLLQHAIETTLDVCRHLGLSLGLKTSDDAHELFIQLVKSDVLTKEFAERNASMVGLRNLLVHEYAAVDHQRIYGYMQEHLADFDEFVRQVSQFLLREGNI